MFVETSPSAFTEINEMPSLSPMILAIPSGVWMVVILIIQNYEIRNKGTLNLFNY